MFAHPPFYGQIFPSVFRLYENIYQSDFAEILYNDLVTLTQELVGSGYSELAYHLENDELNTPDTICEEVVKLLYWTKVVKEPHHQRIFPMNVIEVGDSLKLSNEVYAKLKDNGVNDDCADIFAGVWKVLFSKAELLAKKVDFANLDSFRQILNKITDIVIEEYRELSK